MANHHQVRSYQNGNEVSLMECQRVQSQNVLLNPAICSTSFGVTEVCLDCALVVAFDNATTLHHPHPGPLCVPASAHVYQPYVQGDLTYPHCSEARSRHRPPPDISFT
ncbi:hypothetical protein N7453_003257 [Penicillium expansum]|nr:hypothetical protein N7453_003257 [Penicillium expansum]